MTAETLLIFGASTRAAAFSALRAGLRPWCADLFADRDLSRHCPVVPLPGPYPQSFRTLIDTPLPGPWMYTGGLENWPALVGELARRRPLWGNDEKSLERARDPFFVSCLLRQEGLAVPAVHRDPDDLPPASRWLVKPMRGAGGAGIQFWEPEGPHRPAPGRGAVYFQEHVEGEPCAAVFVSDGRRTWLLGLTRQLVGCDWLHAGPFRYCGSVGPLEPGPNLRADLDRLGTVLAHGCKLLGLFGVDGVLRDGIFWPVEINPRYTASVEVLEYAAGLKSLAWHARAFSPDGLPPAFAPPAPTTGFVGKAILFAREDLVFPADGPWLAELSRPTPPHEVPRHADIPAAGERIRAGRPVLTFFARADSVAECERALLEQAADLDRGLFER
jgi:predicted ATP-grasp superfamily ATP-dependent carboligase